jgi:MoaA/NifB/PqqE/SkfB family radical SAM enzyme
MERENPELAKWGDMSWDLVESIARQLPPGIIVQFHDNGEPLLYPRFGEAVELFHRQIKCTDTNGKLLMEKADEIVDNLDTITISTFEDDPEADEQYKIIKEFLAYKGNRKPNVIIRCLGDMDLERYKKLGCIIATRILHSPNGSFAYKKSPTVPEAGICLDLLSHMDIKRDGRVAMCVRYDPEGHGIIGDANTTALKDIWNSKLRKSYLQYHIRGQRNKVRLCQTCEFWGVPTGR